MLLDQNTVFSDKQAITTASASTHTVDLVAAGNAAPGALFLVCRVDETFAGLTSMKLVLETDDQANFAAATALSSHEFAGSVLQADKNVLVVSVPQGLKRYLRVHYMPTGTATAGKLSCFLTDAVDMH